MRTRLLVMFPLCSIAMVTPAFGTIIGNILPQSAFNVLNGKVTDSIVITGVTDNGVTADLTFTFTALAPGNTGTPALGFVENTRLGVTSSFNQGSSAGTSVNEGESIQLDVTASVTSVPVGMVVSVLNFGIPSIQMVRVGPTNGDIRYLWNSSATSFDSGFYTNTAGAQPVETMDGTSTFDIFGSTYTGTFSVDEGGDNNTNGLRWVTDSNSNVQYSFEAVTIVPEPSAVPEPSTLVMAGLGLLSLGFVGWRRRRR